MPDFGILNAAYGVCEIDPAGPVLFHFVYLIINLTRKRDCTSGNKVMDSISILNKRKPILDGSFCKGNLFIINLYEGYIAHCAKNIVTYIVQGTIQHTYCTISICAQQLQYASIQHAIQADSASARRP